MPYGHLLFDPDAELTSSAPRSQRQNSRNTIPPGETLWVVIGHDALFKSLLRTGRILRDFFETFLPEVASFIDFDRIEFVDKERFTFEGRRRTGDLLIKTRFRGDEAAFLIHLEHEAQARADLDRRMLEYLLLDWRDFDLPVYPIAVLSHPEVGPCSSGSLRLTIRNEDILSFRFAVVDLGRLEAREYARKPNAAAMALSSRMRMDPAEKVALAVDFVRSAGAAKLDRKESDAVSRFFFAYQEFGEEEGLKLRSELGRIEGMDIPRDVLLRNPLVQFGMDKGLRKGRQRETEFVLRLLSRRLGAISSTQAEAVRKLSLAGIEALGEALLDFRSKGDLTRWLKSHPTRRR